MWRRLLMWILVSLAVAAGLVACSAEPAVDPAIQEAVIESVTSVDEPDIDGFCQVTAHIMAGESASAYWRAYSEDSERNIWIVECLTEKTSVTSTGKKTSQETIYSFLYNIDEERLYIEDYWVKICFNLGYDVDLDTSPASLRAPYAGSRK